MVIATEIILLVLALVAILATVYRMRPRNDMPEFKEDYKILKYSNNLWN